MFDMNRPPYTEFSLFLPPLLISSFEATTGRHLTTHIKLFKNVSALMYSLSNSILVSQLANQTVNNDRLSDRWVSLASYKSRTITRQKHYFVHFVHMNRFDFKFHTVVQHNF